MFVLEEQPMICSDPLDRQFAQAHRLVLLVAEVLVEEGTLLVVSGFLVKKVITPHGSTMLNEEEMVLSYGVLVAIWCFWGLFSWLGLAGLGASALVWGLLVLADLPVCC